MEAWRFLHDRGRLHPQTVWFFFFSLLCFMNAEVQSLKQIPCLYFLGTLLLQCEHFLFYCTCTWALSKPLYYPKNTRSYFRVSNMLYLRTSSKKIWPRSLTLMPLIPFSLPSMGRINSNNVFSLRYEPLHAQHLTSEKVLQVRCHFPVFNFTKPLLIPTGDA